LARFCLLNIFLRKIEILEQVRDFEVGGDGGTRTRVWRVFAKDSTGLAYFFPFLKSLKTFLKRKTLLMIKKSKIHG